MIWVGLHRKTRDHTISIHGDMGKSVSKLTVHSYLLVKWTTWNGPIHVITWSIGNASKSMTSN